MNKRLNLLLNTNIQCLTLEFPTPPIFDSKVGNACSFMPCMRANKKNHCIVDKSVQYS